MSPQQKRVVTGCDMCHGCKVVEGAQSRVWTASDLGPPPPPTGQVIKWAQRGRGLAQVTQVSGQLERQVSAS